MRVVGTSDPIPLNANAHYAYGGGGGVGLRWGWERIHTLSFLYGCIERLDELDERWGCDFWGEGV